MVTERGDDRPGERREVDQDGREVGMRGSVVPLCVLLLLTGAAGTQGKEPASTPEREAIVLSKVIDEPREQHELAGVLVSP